jgi:SAM-dependent methyltransferase
MDETTYPATAVEWLIGTDQRSVLEIGAGSGALTRQLIALGHDVHATDASAEAVERLSEALPHVRANAATAERLPNLDGSVDVVVCRDFARYDAEAALGEFARVLRSGGHLALVIETLDTKIPWVRKFARLLERDGESVEAPEALVRSTQFGFVDETQFRHWATVDGDDLCALALADPRVAVADARAQERLLAAVRALYADYGRGRDGMQLPSIAHCFRASVIEHPWSVPPREGTESQAGPAEVQTGAAGNHDGDHDGDDGLLIDFR